MCAIGSKQKDTIRLLVEGGADVNMIYPILNTTPPLGAVSPGHRDNCEILLDAGTINESREDTSVTPLIEACSN